MMTTCHLILFSIVFLEWVTLFEQRWVTSRERRSSSPIIPLCNVFPERQIIEIPYIRRRRIRRCPSAPQVIPEHIPSPRLKLRLRHPGSRNKVFYCQFPLCIVHIERRAIAIGLPNSTPSRIITVAGEGAPVYRGF